MTAFPQPPINYKPDPLYPDSDGQPMADNTLQFQWIQTIQGGLATMFADRDDVFVAGDLLWYPVKGQPKTRTALDAMVVFGRPKDEYRGSYQQWNENNIPPQVVFEVLSEGNRPGEMTKKRNFYEQYGVEEYYLYDPYKVTLKGWKRNGLKLVPIARMRGWVSPLLQIRFEIETGADGKLTLRIYRPDGEAFVTFVEEHQQRKQAEQIAEQEHNRAERELRRRRMAEAEAQRLREILRANGIKFDE